MRILFGSKKRAVIVIILLALSFYLLRSFVFKPKTQVSSTTIKRGDVSEELVLTGMIEADEHANLSFQTSGELSYLGVKEGDVVKKGDVLAKLDTTILYQNFLQAQADLRRYQASLNNVYDQLQGHSDNESYTQIETRTAAEVNKDKAYRAYVSAQQNLANATLKAPFGGVIADVTYPFTGINTMLTTPQIEIFNPNTVYFEVSADQTEVTQLSEGQKVKIVLDSYPSKDIEGTVGYIGSTPKTGELGAVYKVKVLFVSTLTDYKSYKVGMTGDAKFITATKKDVLYVPTQYLKADANGRYILLGSPKNKVYVEAGLENDDKVEVKSDKIQENELVYN